MANVGALAALSTKTVVYIKANSAKTCVTVAAVSL